MLAKIIDKFKVSTLVIFLVIGIIVCAGAFWLLSDYGHGIVSTVDSNQAISPFEAFYFSVVTVSSLGYGDFRPVGLGRIVAIVEVIYGLVLLALIVSKLASDRTSTLVRLIYASDTQRRLYDFIESTEERNQQLASAIADHDYFKVHDIAYKNRTGFSTYKHFLNYHQKHGSIGNDWDSKMLLRLMKKTSESVELANKALREMYTDDKLQLRLSNYAGRAVTLSNHVIEKYDNPHIHAVHSHIMAQQAACEAHIKRIENNPSNAYGAKSTVLTEGLLSRVANALPPKPWKKHVHKAIASELRISNKLAQRAISSLVDSGRI